MGSAGQDRALVDAAVDRYGSDDTDVLDIVEGRHDDGAWVHALVSVPTDAHGDPLPAPSGGPHVVLKFGPGGCAVTGPYAGREPAELAAERSCSDRSQLTAIAVPLHPGR